MRIASGIKLRHLEAFLAIARLRSLTDAAADLGVTQPAISKTLKELESLLGAVLMERGRAGAALARRGVLHLQSFPLLPPALLGDAHPQGGVQEGDGPRGPQEGVPQLSEREWGACEGRRRPRQAVRRRRKAREHLLFVCQQETLLMEILVVFLKKIY